MNNLPSPLRGHLLGFCNPGEADMLRLLQEGNETERHAYYKKLVRTEHIHDFHYPDPTGPPNPSQPCARVMKGTTNMIYCANGYPRDKVRQQCETSIAQDPMRKDLWRCHLCRNDPLMNSHMPVVTFFNKANTDGQPVVTKHQAEMYLCKYCAKKKENHGARSTLYDVLDDMEWSTERRPLRPGWQRPRR